MRSLTDDEIDRFSHAIATDGPAHHEDAMGSIAQVAAAAGAPAGVLEALGDRDLPTVVRSRAWGQAVAAIRRCRTNPEVALVA
jgi:hypothetical protein